jgi:hypothetical protein
MRLWVRETGGRRKKQCANQQKSVRHWSLTMSLRRTCQSATQCDGPAFLFQDSRQVRINQFVPPALVCIWAVGEVPALSIGVMPFRLIIPFLTKAIRKQPSGCAGNCVDSDRRYSPRSLIVQPTCAKRRAQFDMWQQSHERTGAFARMSGSPPRTCDNLVRPFQCRLRDRSEEKDRSDQSAGKIMQSGEE